MSSLWTIGRPANEADVRIGHAKSSDSLAEAGASASSTHGPTPTTISDPVLGGMDYAQFLVLTTLNVGAIVFLGWKAIGTRGWEADPAAFVLLGLIATTLVASSLVRWFLLPLMRRPRPPAGGQRVWRVGVATTFVPAAEPLAMLERSVQALVALDYPHDTWVLDEGNDAAVRAICRNYGALHFSRRAMPQYQAVDGKFKAASKHGNYNAWLAEVGYGRYDIVVAFDPDHVPRANYLSHTLGYFEAPRIGYVQVAQAYGNQAESWIARGAAEETYDYFSIIQMASFRLGYPVIVGGHNIHRVEALREIGGFAAHDADDLLATLNYRAAGWQGVYLPQILARGLTPGDWKSYLTQQRRWARSVLDIKFRARPQLSKTTPLPTRVISLLHGLNYLTKGVLPALYLILLALFCLRRQAADHVASGILPGLLAVATVGGLSEAFRRRFFLDSGNEGGVHWRAAALRWAKWPQMVLALWDVAFDRRPVYSITDKGQVVARSFAWVWPHVAACVAVTVCWIVGYRWQPIWSPWVDAAAICTVAGTGAMFASNFLTPPLALKAGSAGESP